MNEGKGLGIGWWVHGGGIEEAQAKAGGWWIVGCVCDMVVSVCLVSCDVYTVCVKIVVYIQNLRETTYVRCNTNTNTRQGIKVCV